MAEGLPSVCCILENVGSGCGQRAGVEKDIFGSCMSPDVAFLCKYECDSRRSKSSCTAKECGRRVSSSSSSSSEENGRAFLRELSDCAMAFFRCFFVLVAPLNRSYYSLLPWFSCVVYFVF